MSISKLRQSHHAILAPNEVVYEVELCSRSDDSAKSACVVHKGGWIHLAVYRLWREITGPPPVDF
jgi:hypothetical protein